MSASSRPRTPAALGAGLAAFVLAGAVAGNAAAYCRTSSCPLPQAHTAAVCVPVQPDDCGRPIAWPSAQPCVEFSVQQGASNKITFVQTEQVMTAAFAQWTGAACAAGGHPHIQVTEGAPAVCAKHEYNQSAGNANIILYHDDVWPYEGSANTLALTTVTYNLDTGDIYDADMELNSADTTFTVGDTGVDFDLLSIVTHEAGHFLGLAHSHEPSATMWPVYDQHTTALRHISADDVAGICAIYPPGAAITGCDPTPRHGFSDLCGADQAGKGCCTIAPGSDTSRGQHAAVLAALGAFLLVARGARRSRRGRCRRG